MTDSPETAVPQPKLNNHLSDSDHQPLPYPLSVMVESLLFVAGEPVPVLQIAEALSVKIDEVEQALAALNSDTVTRSLRIQRKGDKVQLTTRPDCAPYIERFLGLDLTTRLSKPALETLAIIAYQQPVTRAQIEHVRGVNCDAVLSTLLNRGLIEEVGRLETAGRPIQYGTTFAFLQHFGLRSLDDMPSLQADEADALGMLANQGQATAINRAAPAERVESGPAPVETPAVEPRPDPPAAPIEAQLPLIAAETLTPALPLETPAVEAVRDRPAAANETAPVDQVEEESPLLSAQEPSSTENNAA